jgi:Tfp pilus assembly protein PilF
MDRIEKLKEFLRASPDDSFLQHALALEYVKLGDDETARQLFETILAREPLYVGSYYQLGRLLERMGDNEAAALVYENGMTAARQTGEEKAYGELRSAHEELTM